MPIETSTEAKETAGKATAAAAARTIIRIVFREGIIQPRDKSSSKINQKRGISLSIPNSRRKDTPWAAKFCLYAEFR
jgi:hypothetical protein